MSVHLKREHCPRCGKNVLLCDDWHDTMMCWECGGETRNRFFEPFHERLIETPRGWIGVLFGECNPYFVPSQGGEQR
jgi:ribosomal protein S27AE